MKPGDTVIVRIPRAERPSITVGQFFHACQCSTCRRLWFRDLWRWLRRDGEREERFTVQ
jgi:hypothetical protein